MMDGINKPMYKKNQNKVKLGQERAYLSKMRDELMYVGDTVKLLKNKPC